MMQILTLSLSNDAMMVFGWRIAFLLGALTGVVGVMLRRSMPDPTIFLQRKLAIEGDVEHIPADWWVRLHSWGGIPSVNG
jgi:hypothetical protein